MRTTLVLAFLVAVAIPVAGEEGPVPERPEIAKRVLTLCREGDSYAAAEYVQALGAAPIVGKAYSELVFDLHDAKAAPEMVAMARAGILYLLEHARNLAASDSAKAANWRKAARALAYNLGSFAWPGWGEEGFPIGEAERAAGEEAARTSLRLATELAEGPQSLSAGHWIVGAHHLTAKRHDEAIRSFTEAGAQSRAAKDRPGELMAAGYAALAEVLAGRDAKPRFDAAVAGLRAEGSEDAVFYAGQLESVFRVLSK